MVGMEFLKAETDYRRERLAAQWHTRRPRRHRPQTAELPFGALLHRFGFRQGTVGGPAGAGC